MNNFLVIATAVVTLTEFAKHVRAILPDGIFSFLERLGFGAASNEVAVYPIVLMLLAAYWLYRFVRRLLAIYSARSTFADACEAVKTYRYRTKAAKNGGVQIAKALLSMVTGIYFFACSFLFDYIMPVPTGETISEAIQSLFKLAMALIAMYFFIATARQLRALVASPEQMKRHTVNRVRRQLQKLGIPEHDPADPENGLDARLSKLEHGPILRGLYGKYGRRKRKGLLSRMAVRVVIWTRTRL